MRRERDIKKAAIEYLVLMGYKTYNINNGGTFIKKRNAYAFHGTPGFPDIVAILPGIATLFIECKSDTGKQTPEQKAFEAMINTVPGCHYFLVRDIVDIKLKTDWTSK